MIQTDLHGKQHRGRGDNRKDVGWVCSRQVSEKAVSTGLDGLDLESNRQDTRQEACQVSCCCLVLLNDVMNSGP